MILKLNHCSAIFFSIFTPFLNFSLCLLPDKSVSRDTEEKNDKFEISTEEILRRQELVESHIINMAEKQRDWIETYPSGIMINGIPANKKIESGNPVSKDYPFNNGIPLKGDKRQKMEKDWAQSHQLNSDSSKREIVPDISAESSSKTFPISPGERRHKSEEDKLTNLEMGIETDHQDSKDINAKISSCSCNGIKNVVSNNRFNIKAEEDFSEVIILESAFPEFPKIEKDRFESYNSIKDTDKQNVSPDMIMNSVSSKHIITAESENGNVDFDLLDDSNMEKSVESIYLNSENNKHDILPGNFEKAESVDLNDKFTPNADISLSRHKIKDVPSVKPIDTNKDGAESHFFSINVEKGEIPSSDKLEVKDSMSEFSITEEIHQTMNEINNIRNSLSEAVNREKTLEVGKLESFPNDEDAISNYKYKINSEDTLPPLNHKTYDAFLPEFSEIDHDIESYSTADNILQNLFHAVKELTDLKKVNRNKDSTLCEITNDETCERTVNAKSKSTEEKNFLNQYERNDAIVSKEELPSISEEQRQKQKLAKTFVSSLNEGRENWKEIHQFISQKDADSEQVWKSQNSNINSDRSDSIKRGQSDDEIFRQVYNQERLFFTRWLKKLLNKFGRFPSSGYVTVNFLFVTDILDDIKKLCDDKNFDIVDADKIISSLISNAVVHSGDNISSFYDVSASVSFYMIVGIILLIFLYFTLLHYRIFRVILVFLICISWHGFKMYQEKVAEKHAAVAGSSPAYCESILNKESGLYAHIKEFIRYNAYSDQCEKYFEALMIDPMSELSVSIIVSDFVSSTFFQVFRPMGRALNVFVKDSFSDLGLLQAFYLCVIMVIIFFFCVVCTLIYNRYKLNFPFFMGSVEPTATPVGSGIEDLALEPNADNESAINRDVSKKFNISVVYHTRDCGSSVLHKNSARRYSF